MVAVFESTQVFSVHNENLINVQMLSPKEEIAHYYIQKYNN
jgi:hypothetical protein